MDTFPAAILVIIFGTINGSTLDGPFVKIFSTPASAACRLPTPEPTITPTRNGSSFSISRPASFTASIAAATAYCENNSILFAVLNPRISFPEKSFTSAAIFTL